MTTKKSFVLASDGEVYFQHDDDNQFGFSLESDDQTFRGGVGLGEWSVISDSDPRIPDVLRDSCADL